jgi:hypothetical protein
VTVIPDAVEPYVGWRCWLIEQGQLCSLNAPYLWPLREPLVAECNHPDKLQYVPRRYGRIVLKGREPEAVPFGSGHVLQWAYFYETGDFGAMKALPAPTVLLPEGYGYELEPVPTLVPDPDCSCGIYALKDKQALLHSHYKSSGPAIGAVNLWGRVIPAEHGFRAQFAYPLMIFTDHTLADYGVPTRPFRDFWDN